MGLETILSYYASINKGLSPKVATTYPQVVPVDKVEVNLPQNLHPEWVSGFVAGDGGFSSLAQESVKPLVKYTLDSISLNIPEINN